MRNYRLLCLGLTLLLSISACAGVGEGKDDSANTDVGSPANVEVKLTADRNSVLDNPLNGWVMYASRTSDDTYWDKEVYVADLGMNVKVIDYASACYIRTSWSSLNPSDGVYVWNDPSSKLCRLIRGAYERGKPIAFRVVVDGRDQGANTPQFVYDAGARYWLSDSAYPDRKTPLAIDPVFRHYYEKFIEAFAAEFNDPDKTAFIDAYGLGKWGEGHNVVYEVGNPVNSKTSEYKAETMEWITSLYARCFTKVPLVINYHRHIGHPVSEGAQAQSDSEAVLAIALKNGYCLRSDAIGMNNSSWGYGDWERSFAGTWNYRRPILMEGGWIVGQHSYWNDDHKYRKDHPEDVRKGEFESSEEAKVNMMDFRAGDETDSWFACFDLVQRFVSEGGYRLYPDKVSVPTDADLGDTVQVTHRWVNLGWGYCPTNIPQWNQKYKVAIALLDDKDEPKHIYVVEDSDLSTWLKGKPASYDTEISLKGVSLGSYTWAIGIVDVTKENAIGLKMAVNARHLTKTGWAKLASVLID